MNPIQTHGLDAKLVIATGAGTSPIIENFPLAKTPLWKPLTFFPSAGQFSLNVKKFNTKKKSRNRFLGSPGPGGKKVRKEEKNKFKSQNESVFHSLETSSALEDGRLRQPMLTFFLFSNFFTFRLSCPSEGPKRSQIDA